VDNRFIEALADLNNESNVLDVGASNGRALLDLGSVLQSALGSRPGLHSLDKVEQSKQKSVSKAFETKDLPITFHNVSFAQIPDVIQPGSMGLIISALSLKYDEAPPLLTFSNIYNALAVNGYYFTDFATSPGLRMTAVENRNLVESFARQGCIVDMPLRRRTRGIAATDESLGDSVDEYVITHALKTREGGIELEAYLFR
jgi:hypothetical protein